MIPKAVVFDWDVTLVNSVSAIHASLEQTFAKFGKLSQAWSLEDVADWLRKSMRVSFKDLFGENANEAADYFYVQYKENHLKEIILMPHALETLQMLQTNKIYLSVVSSKKGELVREEASILKIQHYFHKLIGSSDAAEDKPAVAPMSLALSGKGLELGSDIWYVGDCGVDVVCARNSNCYSIIIGQSPALIGETIHRPDEHFADHKAFQAFIKSKFNTI